MNIQNVEMFRNSFLIQQAASSTPTQAWRQAGIAMHTAKKFFDANLKPNKNMTAKKFWELCGFSEAQISAKKPELYVRVGKINNEIFEAFIQWVKANERDHSGSMKSFQVFAKSAAEVGLENAKGNSIG